MILQTREDVLASLLRVRHQLPLDASKQLTEDWAQIETFCAIALRVMAKTNMSKLISETRTVELSALLAGRIVFDPD